MNDSSQRLSRISLTDDGPVLPAKGKDTTSQSQPGSAPRSVKSNDSLLSTDSSGQPHYNNGVPPPFLTIFAQDGELRPSRDSMISLTEMEHGWSSHPSGLKSKARSQYHRTRSSEGDAIPTYARYNADQPSKPTYRPAFAPNVTDADLDGLVPSLGSQSAPNTPQKPLSRGRSLREKLQGVISGNKNASSSTTSNIPIPEEDGADKDDEDKKDDGKHAYVVVGETSPRKEKDSMNVGGGTSGGFGAGIARRLSRKTTTRTRRDEDPGYTMPSQAELDQIPLYAAPPEAKVPNAPMLSSYAPRPALRPRAMTADGSILPGSSTLKPQPSITVGQARLAYAKSLSRQRPTPNSQPMPSSNTVNSVSSSASTINPSHSSNSNGGSHGYRRSRVSSTDSQEEHLQMNAGNRRSGRRSRAVPEGWAKADGLLQEVSSSEERDSPKGRAVGLPPKGTS